MNIRSFVSFIKFSKLKNNSWIWKEKKSKNARKFFLVYIVRKYSWILEVCSWICKKYLQKNGHYFFKIKWKQDDSKTNEENSTWVGQLRN